MKEENNKIWIIAIIIFSIISLGAVGFIIFDHMNQKKANDEYQQLASSYANLESDEPEMTAPEIHVELAENPIDFEELQDINDEIYSWIYVPDTNVNYPVVQSLESDNYYLDKSIYKNYRFAGAIYSQFCNNTNYLDRVTVLYGHNMADGSMFNTLHKFEDEDFFDEHEYFYVYTTDRKLTYRIVSAFQYDDRHIMNSFDFSKDSVFQEYLDMIRAPHSALKNVREGIELTTNDKILTLSTCLNSGYGRYLVQGVLINDERTK
ncbi:MAG: class B sortase [Ruminococcus sp.]|nr:class B sortase [Ruminococcus sp.]